MKVSTENIALTERYSAAFEDFERRLNGARESHLHHKRREALHRFEASGFPHKKMEDWRYTDLIELVGHNWTENRENTAINIENIQKFLPEGFESHLLVFVDGNFSEELSHYKTEDVEIVISPLHIALKQHREMVEHHLGKYAKDEKNSLIDFNTAFAERGVFVHVPKGKIAKYPIHVLYLSGAGKVDTLNQIRNLIIAEERAHVTVFEQYASIGNTPNWTNAVTEVFAGEHSHVNHYKLQNEEDTAAQTNFTQFRQEAGSNCKQITATLGGKLVRNNLNFHFNGQHAESLLYGLYLPTQNQHIDNQSFVDHAVPNCYSNELYKGIMRDKATGVFNGKIMVRPDAQKTNAYQSNKNILMSKDARINAKPQLEIFADDVKCSHGATIGQLDEDAIFYLRARGLSEHDARVLMTHAFALEVLEHLPSEPLRNYIDRLIEAELDTV